VLRHYFPADQVHLLDLPSRERQQSLDQRLPCAAAARRLAHIRPHERTFVALLLPGRDNQPDNSHQRVLGKRPQRVAALQSMD
jgi:hypothetical protein